MLEQGFSVFALTGIGEIDPGDNLAEVIEQAAQGNLLNDDILAISSKIFSKAEARILPIEQYESAIESETVRVVATKTYPGGITRIVQNRNGLIMASAGVDLSNAPDGTLLLLPKDPDSSARNLRAELAQHLGIRLGVLITDTFGRPWRIGQTDVAIGAAGIQVDLNLKDAQDAHGRTLKVTHTAVADELAAASDVVKGKSNQCPIAVIRGLSHLVTDEDGPGAAALIRPKHEDMFTLGTREAFDAGYDAGRNETVSNTAKPAERNES